MKRFFDSKYGPLVFSLISGLAYFVLAMVLILENTGNKGIILGVFFCPAIICGVALVLLKSIKMHLAEKNYNKIYLIASVHILVVAVAVLLAISTVAA